MDPLSVAASVLAVLTAAGKTAQGLEQIWALRDASKDLLCVMSELSSLRTTLRVVEISLRSLQHASNSSLLLVLHDIEALRLQASTILGQLDNLVTQKLQKSPKGSSQAPKVAKVSWVRQQKNLARLQNQMKAITQNLSTTLTALNAIQIATTQRPESVQITFSMQGISTLGQNLPGASPSTEGPQTPILTQLDRVLHNIIAPVHLNVRELDGNRGSLSPVPTMSAMSGTISRATSPTLAALPSPEPDTVRIVASIGSSKCDRFCQCQCHIRSQVRTPKWTRRVFGSFYLQTNGTALLNRRGCNFALCRRSGKTSTQITYYTPSWMLRGAFYISASKDDLGGMGGSLAFKMPREVDYTLAWPLVAAGSEERLLDMFCKGQASIYDVDKDGESLLHYAARTVQPEICRRLIQLGADPLFSCHNGVPALEYGLDHVFANPPFKCRISPEAVDLFFAIFANDDIYDSLGFTPLHRIVLGLSGADLRTQLQLTILDINTADNGGRTPIMWAARRGDIDSLRTLIEFGADVKKPDRSKVTPIHKAVADADDECVEILLEAGADVNVSDLQLGQPIHGIFFSPLNRTATIDALVAHGANLDACNATDSRPLHWAASMQKEGRLDNVRHFVYRGADINAVDFWGDSPVMEALRCSDAELFGCLIELGARLDLRRKKGDINILHIAAWSADMECWDILANAAKVGKLYGVDTRTPHEGHSVLDCLEACRDKMFAGERGSRELEKEKFSALIRLVEGTLTSVFELQA